jgi:hypothetical protein
MEEQINHINIINDMVTNNSSNEDISREIVRFCNRYNYTPVYFVREGIIDVDMRGYWWNDVYPYTLLMCGVYMRDVEMVSELLELGADVDTIYTLEINVFEALLEGRSIYDTNWDMDRMKLVNTIFEILLPYNPPLTITPNARHLFNTEWGYIKHPEIFKNIINIVNINNKIQT